MDALELKLLRVKRGLRQYVVAARVGIAPCRLSEIETGRRVPSPELLERILKVITGDGSESTAEKGKGQ